MIELYHALTSTCSQKVRLCLAEKGLEYAERRLNLAAGEHLTPDYLAINPNGVVPALVHDGAVILDSSVICEYLDEMFPHPALVPRHPAQRAAMRAWLRYFEEVPTAAIRVPSFHQALARRFEGLDPETFAKDIAAHRPLRKNFYLQMGPHGFSEEDVARSMDELDHTLARMEIVLSGKQWIMGDEFTLADIVITPTIDRMQDLGLSGMWADRPEVSRWYAAIRARRSFDAAYPRGARLSDVMPVEKREATASV